MNMKLPLICVVAAWAAKLHDPASELKDAYPDLDGIREEPHPASGSSAGITQELLPGRVDPSVVHFENVTPSSLAEKVLYFKAKGQDAHVQAANFGCYIEDVNNVKFHIRYRFTKGTEKTGLHEEWTETTHWYTTCEKGDILSGYQSDLLNIINTKHVGEIGERTRHEKGLFFRYESATFDPSNRLLLLPEDSFAQFANDGRGESVFGGMCKNHEGQHIEKGKQCTPSGEPFDGTFDGTKDTCPEGCTFKSLLHIWFVPALSDAELRAP